MSKRKVYLGDSVYADFDGFHIVLYTDNGGGPNLVKEIFLEDSVFLALEKYGREQFNFKMKERGKSCCKHGTFSEYICALCADDEMTAETSDVSK